jgi:hypothetical protein
MAQHIRYFPYAQPNMQVNRPHCRYRKHRPHPYIALLVVIEKHCIYEKKSISQNPV